MLNDVVNKLVFDFACSSEQVAKRMNDALTHYEIQQISSVLSDVLQNHFHAASTWKIDMLEIDLGDINVDDMETGELMNRFEKLLIQHLDTIIFSKQEDAVSGSTIHTSEQNDFEIIKEYLVHGDLPWWINKTGFLNLKEVFEKVTNSQGAQLQLFLRQQPNHAAIIQRLQTLYSIEKRSSAYQILYGIAPDVFNGKKFSIRVLTAESLTRLLLVVKKPVTAESEIVKNLLVDRLLRSNDKNLLQHIDVIGVLTENEIKELKTALIHQRSKAFGLLNKFNVFQLEFLLLPPYITEQGITIAAEYPEDGPDNTKQKKAISKAAGQSFSDITDKLGIGSYPIDNYLSAAPLRYLEILRKLFDHYKNYDLVKGRLANLVIAHPYFFRYKLLYLLLNLSTENTGNENDTAPDQAGDENRTESVKDIERILQASRLAFQQVTEQLSTPRARFLQKILVAGKLPSVAAGKKIASIINTLPDTTIQLLAGLTQLPEAEIESLAAVDSDKQPATEPRKKVIIENAGLCLLAPYLPAFFTRLGFTEKGKFKTAALAHRAVYVVQYIVTGRQLNYEYDLQFNKLLCGLFVSKPITGYKRLTTLEKKEADDLVASAISHWAALKSTSPKGFCTSFLQRKGILTEGENTWVLQVEKKPYDLLLDSLPWQFNIIKTSWMPKMIQVEW